MSTRLRVLVVDDDQLTLELVGTTLANQDIDVLGLRDSREAVVRIEEEKFDGIFLDLSMPGLNGLELARRIRASLRNATTPIAVITGRSDSGAMKEAFSAGAHFFLSKPLDLSKLRHLVNTMRGTLLQERRRNRRVAVVVEISCRAESGSFTGMTSQVSEQGVVFRLADLLHPGELVRLAFRLPISSQGIEAIGVVVRTDAERNIACQLKKVDDASREILRRFVASVGDNGPEELPEKAA